MQVNVPDYGSDQAGLICGFRFSPGGRGEPIEAAEAIGWLDRGKDRVPEDFIWLHFNLANAATERWLKAHLSLSEVFFESLHDGSFSTRVEHVDESLIAVTNVAAGWYVARRRRD
jgi:zinc transporter